MQHKRDFATDTRLLRIVAIAVGIGVAATGIAFGLLALIRFFTNLFFYQRVSFANVSPAHHALGLWVALVPASGGLLVGLIARYGSDKIRGHGIPEAMEAIVFGKSRMSPKVAVLKPLSSGIVIGSGGPFGAEGPIIMTGGALGSLVAQAFHLTAAERKTLLVAGAAAGMTAVFGTPVAAVLLAVELLLFEWRPRSLVPVALAASVAAFLRPYLLDPPPLFPVHLGEAPIDAIGYGVIAGIVSGALASVMSAAVYKVEDAFHRLPLHWMWWPAIGGLAVGVGGWIEPRALGVGYDVIGDLLGGHLPPGAVVSLLLVKCVIWVIALGSGTSGGVLAPLLMIGAGVGTAMSALLPVHASLLWPLVCMAAVLAGTMGAPLTAVAFALELTHGVEALVPLLFACTISYGLTVLLMRRSILTEKIARRGYHIYREYSVDPMERSFVEDIMTRQVEAIPAGLALGDVAHRYFGADQRHRAYPVLDDAGSVVGMVDRETLARLVAGHAPGASLRTLLQRPPPVALPNETCRHLAARLAKEGLDRIAVVDDAATMRLLGVVSRADLVKISLRFFEDEHRRERLIHWSRSRAVARRG